MLMESARASRRKEQGAGQAKPQHQLYDPFSTLRDQHSQLLFTNFTYKCTKNKTHSKKYESYPSIHSVKGQVYIYPLLQFSRSVMSDSLLPHGLQHARLLCPSLSPRVCTNSWPLNWRCCLTISSSTASFSFCLQSFPASGSFSMSQLFALGSQSIGAAAS